MMILALSEMQIAYLFYDKNKKYLFALVYDKNVNKVDKYFRNVGVELGLNMNLKNYIYYFHPVWVTTSQATKFEPQK